LWQIAFFVNIRRLGLMLKELKPPGQATISIIIIIGLQCFVANCLLNDQLASEIDGNLGKPSSGNKCMVTIIIGLQCFAANLSFDKQQASGVDGNLGRTLFTFV